MGEGGKGGEGRRGKGERENKGEGKEGTIWNSGHCLSVSCILFESEGHEVSGQRTVATPSFPTNQLLALKGARSHGMCTPSSEPMQPGNPRTAYGAINSLRYSAQSSGCGSCTYVWNQMPVPINFVKLRAQYVRIHTDDIHADVMWTRECEEVRDRRSVRKNICSFCVRLQ